MNHKIYVRREVKNLGFTDVHRNIRRAVNAVLDYESADAPCEVNILLTDDTGIAKINSEYRGMDKPTDVLSFPQFDLIPGAAILHQLPADPETGRIFLGDIAISVVRANAQAEEYGHSAEHEITYLTVHSTLHLLGYDHIDEAEDKAVMRAKEKAIMSSMSNALTRE